jgi:YHS domain-containing protein
MFKNSSVLILAAASILSCNSVTQNKPSAIIQQDSMQTKAKNNFKNIVFASEKDPSCGMPVSAGIEDTVTYKGKLYGFCSTECKEEFLKNPKAYLPTK